MLSRIISRSLVNCSARSFSTRNVAGNIFFNKEHEYIKIVSPGVGYIGISNHAQEALGDLVYIDLPSVDAEFDKNASFGAVESVKSSNDVYAPVTMRVLEVNEELAENAALVNESAEDRGWLVKVEFSNEADLADLFDAEAYQNYINM